MFFSGIISSVPISLLLSFTNFNDGPPEYLIYMAIACVFSVITMFFAFYFTITLIKAKDAMKDIRQKFLYSHLSEFSNDKKNEDDKLKLHNKTEYEVDKWLTEDSNGKKSRTKYAKTLRNLFGAFIVFAITTLIFIVVCWKHIF